MHPDYQPYIKFTGRGRLDKSVNSLMGIIEGIAIDGSINNTELNFLDLWLSEHGELRTLHPFNELIPVVEAVVADRVLSIEERADLAWLCKKLTSSEFYDQTTSDLQRLHAILGGIIADTRISEEELRGLTDWMEDHSHLISCWPFDEVGSLITSVLKDKRIDDEEHAMLHDFFSEFVALADDRTLTSPLVQRDNQAVVGLCAVCPEISFDGKHFVFTGASARFKRSQLAETITLLGGKLAASMSKKVDYLVIGSEGNPCWAYACYGRKVEQAIELRKAGARLLIVHEHDFHDAIADFR